MRLLSVLVILAVILGGAWLYIGRGDNGTVTKPLGTLPVLNQKIEVTKTDISQNGVSKLPPGFPGSIPVETANITESFRTVFKEQNTTSYGVSYTSLKSRDALWDIYSKYLKDAGYSINNNASSKSLGQISGVKDGSTLSVVVSAHSGLTLVQLSLLSK